MYVYTLYTLASLSLISQLLSTTTSLRRKHMTTIYDAEKTSSTMITPNDLPAVLIGGPPNAGKSVLTYNLTRELRRRRRDGYHDRGIPHYVFRANPDIEGDWFLQDDQD